MQRKPTCRALRRHGYGERKPWCVRAAVLRRSFLRHGFVQLPREPDVLRNAVYEHDDVTVSPPFTRRP